MCPWATRNTLPSLLAASHLSGWGDRGGFLRRPGSIRSSQRKNEAPCNLNGCAFFVSSSAAFSSAVSREVVLCSCFRHSDDGNMRRGGHARRFHQPLPLQPQREIARRASAEMSGLLRFRGDRWRPVDQGRESPYGHSEGKSGNAHEMHSIIKSELIPGGKSLRTEKQSVFFSHP